MQKEVVSVVVVDDLDHETPAETVRFTHEGQQYEIDLSDSHKDELLAVNDSYELAKANFEQAQEHLSLFLERARRVPDEVPQDEVAEQRTKKTATRRKPAKGRKVTKTKAGKGATEADIRAWARANGVTVNAHGRIPKAVREQYLAAS